jgi:hypothetical protein
VLLEAEPPGFSVLGEVLALLALKDSEITMNLACLPRTIMAMIDQ